MHITIAIHVPRPVPRSWGSLRGKSPTALPLTAGTNKKVNELMAEGPRTILICSCEDTMPLDGEAVRRACRSAEVVEGRQLCRAELDRFRKAAAKETVTVACTQEAPLFSEVAGEIG